nr:MAG TPA: hypothetical protein [Bacteriophage sp.]
METIPKSLLDFNVSPPIRNLYVTEQPLVTRGIPRVTNGCSVT